MIKYKITKAVSDGTELTVIAKCCEQIGTRKDEHDTIIPIIQCRNVTVVILTEDLPKTGQLDYIKTQIEAAYVGLPDETLVKSLLGKTWSS